jgi:dodecin
MIETDAEQQNDATAYRVIEIVGTSPMSWEAAAQTAVHEAAKTHKDLRIAEITKLDIKIEDDKIVSYRVRVTLSFKPSYS